jgi:hypothetical protein
MTDDVAVWSGELLWTQDLEVRPVIDCRAVISLGFWSHDWFRAHPGLALIGLAPGVRQQLQAAGLPVICYDRLSDAQAGVGLAERLALWDEGDEPAG